MKNIYRMFCGKKYFYSPQSIYSLADNFRFIGQSENCIKPLFGTGGTTTLNCRPLQIKKLQGPLNFMLIPA
jgi:hypothetical protein